MVPVRVLPALRRAIDASVAAKRQFAAITPKARKGWVQWVTAAKQEQTRERRIAACVQLLAQGREHPSV